MSGIVSDESVRSGEPRVDGTRITVLDVKRRIIDGGEDPHVVAGEYDLSMAELFHALAFYYDHRDEFEEREREAEMARREGERRTGERLDGSERQAQDASDRTG